MACAYSQCPLRLEAYAQFRYDQELQPCASCGTRFYCSQRCAQQDWFKGGHQYSCEGAALAQDEVLRIESQTPFIKDGALIVDGTNPKGKDDFANHEVLF